MLVIYLREEVCKNENEEESTNRMDLENDLYPISTDELISGTQPQPINSHFSCEVCDKRFDKKEDLQRHYSFHIVGKPFVCKKCESTFMRESALTMHRCPADVQSVEIPTADVKDRPSMPIKVVKNKKEKPYICEVCDVKFLSKSNLKLHLKKNKCITVYNCSICSCNFKQLSGLAKHHNKIHLGVDLKDDCTENTQTTVKPDLPHFCEVCGMRFSKKVYLIQHLPVHKGEKALHEYQKNLEKEENIEIKFERKELPKKQTQCDVCGKKFTKQFDILHHMSTHTGEKAYKCDVCGKHYISKSTLLVHTRRFHSGKRPYACDLCPRAFLRKPELDNHYFIHQDNKPYSCGVCKTGFCHRKSLERHIRMQTCIGAPEGASLESMEQMSDDNSKEIKALKDSKNSSDSEELDFSWPSPPSDMRKTRSYSARQKEISKNSMRLSKLVSSGLTSEICKKPQHFSIKETNASQKPKKLSSMGGEQNTTQDYFPSQSQRYHTTNNMKNNHLNSHLSANTDFIPTDEDSEVLPSDMCRENSKSKHYLKNNSNHMQGEIIPEPYLCTICGLGFRLKQDLAAHSNVHEVKDNMCVGCNLSLDEEFHFISHVCKNPRYNHTCQTSKKSLTERKQNKQVQIYEKDLFLCSMCSKSFELEKDLKYHLASHALNKGFFCNICPKAFYLEKDLNNHALAHSKKNSYACKVCQEVFQLENNLKKHLLTHWSSGFICKHCHNGFSMEEELKSHVDTCPSKNNFVCNICQKSFLLKCALVSHAKIHQRDPEKKQFNCNVCTKTFLKNTDFKQHLRSHTGEKHHFCPECGKGYFLKESLRAHLRYHNGNRPHACNRCDKTYVCKRDLDIHYLKHTDGLTSYICDTCGQGFCLKKGLVEHLLKEHRKTYNKGD